MRGATGQPRPGRSAARSLGGVLAAVAVLVGLVVAPLPAPSAQGQGAPLAGPAQLDRPGDGELALLSVGAGGLTSAVGGPVAVPSGPVVLHVSGSFPSPVDPVVAREHPGQVHGPSGRAPPPSVR